VLVIVKGVQQGDGHHRRPGGQHLLDDVRDRVGIQWPHDSLRFRPLGHGQDPLARNERLGMMPCEIVERRAILPAQLEQVGRTRCRTQHHACAGSLEQSVGRHGRAMRDVRDVARPHAERRERIEHSLALIARRRQHLSRFDAAVRRDRDEIGERSADVDADGKAAHSRRRRTRDRTTNPIVARRLARPIQSPTLTNTVVAAVVCT
jgi:hypothetical protein